MLVLTRNVGETIEMPELGIVVTILSVRGGVVKLGVEAPKDMKVLRGELVGTEPRLKTVPAVS